MPSLILGQKGWEDARGRDGVGGKGGRDREMGRGEGEGERRGR